MIPKVIHYIWFGPEKSIIVKKAIETWEKRAPEYQIVEWNEHNLPDYQNTFYQKALENDDYAFASDYARLRILQQYGGIYMDADMYLLKNPSELLKNRDLVFGIQNKEVIISAGFIAAVPNQPFIKAAINLYENTPYTKGTNKPNTELLSPLIFKKYKFKHVDQTQVNGRVTAFNSDILLQPSFRAVALHIGEKTWAAHSRHDEIRIKMRQHITNQFSAGVFRIANDIFRKII